MIDRTKSNNQSQSVGKARHLFEVSSLPNIFLNSLHHELAAIFESIRLDSKCTTLSKLVTTVYQNEQESIKLTWL